MSDLSGGQVQSANNDAGEMAELRVADEELLETLRTQGNAVTEEAGLVLTNIDFAGSHLAGLVLTHARISGAIFDRSYMSGVCIAGSVIENTTFRGANLTESAFPDSELFGVDFSEANLEGANFTDCYVEAADVREANLSRAVFDHGAVDVDFATADNVQGLNISHVENLDYQKLEILSARDAIVHPGSRCPRCEKRARAFADPDCQVCEGQGWIDCDEEELANRYSVKCPWCRGAGQVIFTIAGEGSCFACEQTGMVGTWVIDRRQHDKNLPWEYDKYKTEDDELGWFSVEDTDLSGLSFKSALVEETSFHNCSLSGTDFSGSRFKGVTFVECDLTGVVLADISMHSVRLKDCEMARAIWTGGRVRLTTASGCDFSDAALSRQRLRKILEDGSES